jgi:hypothetical protein
MAAVKQQQRMHRRTVSGCRDGPLFDDKPFTTDFLRLAKRVDALRLFKISLKPRVERQINAL